MIGTVAQLLVGAQQADQLEPADMRQLDVGDHQVGREGPRAVERQAAVGHRLRLVAVRREQVAEQLDVERIVLDDQDLGQTILPSRARRAIVSHERRHAKRRRSRWRCARSRRRLADQRLAERFLSLTGIDPPDLRQSGRRSGLLAALLRFLEAHEPDLVAVAEEIGVKPEALVAARRELEQ